MRLPSEPSRRTLLKLLAAGGASSVACRLGLGRVLAGTPTASAKRRFVFVYAPGGWDSLLFLDPREHEIGAGNESAYRKEVERTQIDTGYLYGPNRISGSYIYGLGLYFDGKVHRLSKAPAKFSFGPAVVPTNIGTGNSLLSLSERGVPMAIVRGINMGTLGHEPGLMYFLTGEPAVGSTARGTSMPIRIAARLGETAGGIGNVISPVAAIGMDSFTGDKSGAYAAFALSSISDASRSLRRDAELQQSPQVEAALAAHAARPGSPALRATQDSAILRQLGESRSRTAALLASQLDKKFGFLSGADAESVAVRAQYNINPGASETSAGALAAFAATTLKAGLSQFVSLKFADNFLDSHGSANPAHIGGLYPCIAAVANLVDDLSKSPAPDGLPGSMLDHTTIVMFSEFSRAPLFNKFNDGVGRDHHFSNSCLLIGAGIQGPSVIGSTTEVGGMQPSVFDFEKFEALPDSAKPNASNRYITPEDIGATLLASAGLDYSEYRIGRPLWPILTVKPG